MRIVVVYKFSVYNKNLFSKSTQTSAINPGCTHIIYNQINNCRSVPLLRFVETKSSAGAEKNKQKNGQYLRRRCQQLAALCPEGGGSSGAHSRWTLAESPANFVGLAALANRSSTPYYWRTRSADECVSSVVPELKFDKRRTNVLVRNSDLKVLEKLLAVNHRS